MNATAAELRAHRDTIDKVVGKLKKLTQSGEICEAVSQLTVGKMWLGRELTRMREAGKEAKKLTGPRAPRPV